MAEFINNRKQLSLKVKLIISYITISLLLVVSLVIIARNVINSQFENYVRMNQEKNTKQIVNQVISAYRGTGKLPSDTILNSLGQNALEKGFALRIEDTKGSILWCMNPDLCGHVLSNIEENMNRLYPNFSGDYVEKSYPVTIKGVNLATVILRYYGPFYYNNTEVEFLSMLNYTFIIGAVLALILSVIVGLFMANRISEPIYKVIEKTKMIEQGNYKDVIEINSNTKEVEQLIHSVNSLANTLDSQMNFKKRLARDYAHEFRTPLASLQSNLEAMIDGIWTADKERLESLYEEILRLTRMVGNIESLVSIEQENDKLMKSSFNLKEFISKVVVNFESDLFEKGIHLAIEGSSSNVYADKDKIGQVIINLLSNAIKYSNHNSNIFIRIKEKNTNVILSVKDYGIGIEKDELELIFEHLYRTDKSRASQTGGSGVGLAIVKSIVLAHGGKIEVNSKIGRGSEFIVTLPK
jgi:signal transduction histidine kinase